MRPAPWTRDWTLATVAALMLCAGAALAEEQAPAAAPAEKPQEQPKEVDQAVEATRQHIDQLKKEGRIDTDKQGWRTQLPKYKTPTFSGDSQYYWVLDTTVGEVKIRFLPKVAPNHVANFMYLTELGYFDGLAFHRIIQGFMAQGGCPLGTGTGGPGYQFAGEYDAKVKHDRPGILSMANTGQPSTDGSQFFITFVPTPHLNMRHTVFGEVVEGMDTVKDLEKCGSRDGSGRTSKRVAIEKARVVVEPAPKE